MSSKYAARQLAKKLRLEAQVAPRLRRFFRSVNAEVVRGIKKTGTVPTLASRQPELADTLRAHYLLVIGAFLGDASASMTKGFTPAETKAAPDVTTPARDRLLLLADGRADAQAGQIMKTTQQDAEVALAAVIAAMPADRQPRQKVATETGKRLDAAIPGRVELVAAYETQQPAEQTKQTEAEALITGAIMVGTTILRHHSVKTWHAILDERTRLSHALADRQEKLVNDGFIVQDQTLMFPGDTSHGATLDNVLFCRCSSEYTVVPG